MEKERYGRNCPMTSTERIASLGLGRAPSTASAVDLHWHSSTLKYALHSHACIISDLQLGVCI